MLSSQLFELGLLKLVFEILKFLGQINHLSRIAMALFPGLLCGIEGLMRLA